MNKETLIKLGVSEDIVDLVLEAIGKTVPYGKFQEINEEKNRLKDELSKRDEQLKELAKVTKDNEDLNLKIKELEDENKKSLEETELKLSQLKLDNSIELALTKAGANNNKTVKVLLDMEKIKLENDTLVGLEEQLTSLKESDSYLFKQEEVTETIPLGLVPEISNGGVVTNSGVKSYEDFL